MDRGREDLTDAKVEAFLARPGDWRAEMAALRPLLLDSGLSEALKWGQPCYTHKGANLAIMGGFKSGLRLTFFQGALLQDKAGLLVSPGENSRAARYLNFTTPEEITGQAPLILAYLAEARTLLDQGRKVDLAADPEPPAPPELDAALADDPALKAAFQALTPGRRRYWLIHFAEAKQSATRTDRIRKARDKILAGKGMNEA